MKVTAAVMVLSLATLTPTAKSAPPAEPPKDALVLDLGRGSFRAFEGWKTPTLISADGKLKPMLEPKRKGQNEEDRKPLPIRESSRPASNWATLDFDDSVWPRVSAPVAYHDPLAGNLVCLRGTFTVADPAQVADLRLSVRYFGGAVAYVNGAELQRGHLPAGKLASDAMATSYPDEAYLSPDGKPRPFNMNPDPKFLAERIAGRQRELPAKGFPDGVAIPGSMLRKGVNVIAIEVRSAPANERVVGWASVWPHALLLDARLTAGKGFGPMVGFAATEGAAVAPSAGIEIGNSQPIETLYAYQRAHPSERVHPIRMIGARNGVFSGKVVLSSTAAIKNLKATVSELSQAGGKGRIPAAAVQTRLAEQAVSKVSWATHWASWACYHFDRLLTTFPAEIPALEFCPLNPEGHAVSGRWRVAVAPVWVTVRVPADALAGEYEGTLTIEADGTPPARFTVPVRLKVNGWKLPDPKEFVVHNDIYQSPDSVARYYNVPLWSEKHWQLISQSMKAFSEVGNKMCILHLAVDSKTLGNTESMVRWVKKAGGGYDYDFTVAEKYMDLYEKTSGKPGLVRLEAWQRPVDPKVAPTLSVTVVDPATGKLELLAQPPYATPENEAFWKPMLTELRKRLERRGWFDVAAFSWIHYNKSPEPEILDVLRRIWPDGKWMHTAHTNPREYGTAVKGVTMPVRCVEYVWGAGTLYNPDGGGQYPRAWKLGASRIDLGFPRFGVAFINAIGDASPLTAYRLVTEAAIQGNLRGVGYLGGDFWPIPFKDNRYVSVNYGFQGIAMTDSIRTCFSPGPDGAAFNGRMEMFREGVQACEAIIFLQRAVEDKKVSGELAAKIANVLDERARQYLQSRHVNGDNWLVFESSDWQDRDDKLFALCAEVAGARQ
ncbi:MAG: hypothetical protein PHU85_13265 [Phycisphaerae bacterium]|nr:hypothetical protein [Phycisphaerae bacterium]